MKTFGTLSSPWSLATAFLLVLTLPTYVTGGRGKKGDSCKRDPDCDQESFIGCDRTTRTCDCPQTSNLRLYYTLDRKCVSYVDGLCTYMPTPNLPSINCVENAVCVKLRDPTEVNGKCICKTGYYRTTGNQCAKNMPISSTSNTIGGGGIETPRSKDGATKLSSTRYPEPYHSMSRANNAWGHDTNFKIFAISLLCYILKIWQVI